MSTATRFSQMLAPRFSLQGARPPDRCRRDARADSEPRGPVAAPSGVAAAQRFITRSLRTRRVTTPPSRVAAFVLLQVQVFGRARHARPTGPGPCDGDARPQAGSPGTTPRPLSPPSPNRPPRHSGENSRLSRGRSCRSLPVALCPPAAASAGTRR